MRNESRLWLLLPLILLFSCRSITGSRTETGIPVSVVYFSFDDGPNSEGDTTARLLDVLKKYEIQALFCLLGENAEQNPELVRRIAKEGHCIVNHGYSGKWARKMRDDEFRENLLRGEAAISAALGFGMNPKLYRPHGGFYTSAQEKIFRDAGYSMVPGTVRAYDANLSKAGCEKAVRKIINKTEKQGGGIILLHDGRDSQSRLKRELEKNPQGVFDRSWIPDAVEEIIIALLERGFIFNGPDILPILK